ncbi:MAG: type II toxin-antitoxin system HicB family antitoxin [Candidatus ainarchaeum sp.]|nr:type II toxin-antitoxin system HicB family antitoxin [Candidatus ainarchaeum sp.]
MEFDVVFEKQKEGGFTVYVPGLPGCISEGETKLEALKNVKEAISLYLEEKNKSEIRQLLDSVSIEKAAVKIHA